jgi:5-methylcytosine-specific restriction protein A
MRGSRTEFPAVVKRQAWDRCGGRCERCTAKLFPAKFAYDHIIADGLGGDPTLENCAVLCTACHHAKTVDEDRPVMDKADRVRRKWLGQAPKSRRPIQSRGFQIARSE